MKSLNIQKDILEDLYNNKNLTAAKISDELKVSIATIQNYLHKYNINIKGAKHFLSNENIQFSEQQYEFFDGLIFSDGSIVVKKNKNGKQLGTNQISCAFKYREFAEYINKYLQFNSKVGEKKSISTRYKNGYCITYNLMSPCDSIFTKERQRWYPFGKKIIPDDFRFSPISMNIAYLGDGSIGKNCKQNYITISTQSFEKENIENKIIKNLHDLNIQCWMRNDGTMYIPKKSVIDFLNYIGQCPVDCYKYKWDISGLEMKRRYK